MNPLSTSDLKVIGKVVNPTAGSANPRSFKVASVWIEVFKPDGSKEDWGKTGQVDVPVGGYNFDSGARKFANGGSHSAVPKMQLLSGAVVPGNPIGFTIAVAATTRQNRDDGSVWDVTAFSDGRQSVEQMIEGPVTPIFQAGSVG